MIKVSLSNIQYAWHKKLFQDTFSSFSLNYQYLLQLSFTMQQYILPECWFKPFLFFLFFMRFLIWVSIFIFFIFRSSFFFNNFSHASSIEWLTVVNDISYSPYCFFFLCALHFLFVHTFQCFYFLVFPLFQV